MKNRALIISIGILLVNIIFWGCLKDKKSRPAPTISFLTGGNHYDGVSLVPAGQSVLVGITCTWNGTDPIRGLNIYANNNLVSSLNVSDSLAKGFTLDSNIIIKSEADNEEWIFKVSDSQGASGYGSFTIPLDKQGGTIQELTAMIASQKNANGLCFYSLYDNTTKDSVSSISVQSKIDMLGAYDDINGNHLVSPNANSLPTPFPIWMLTWTTKNDTKFCATNLTSQQFDIINLDNLLISSYSTNTSNQKNKAKNLKVNDVYSFKLQDGRYGLFKVSSVVAGLTGSVGIKVKIQTPKSK